METSVNPNAVSRQIIGDDIYFNGEKVATISPNVIPTTREMFERFMNGNWRDFK